jgi:hypothetical protein
MTGSPVASEVSRIEIVVALDELAEGRVRSARSVMPFVAGTGADAVKLIACRIEDYTTRPLDVIRVSGSAGSQLGPAAESAPQLTRSDLEALRAAAGALQVEGRKQFDDTATSHLRRPGRAGPRARGL